MPTVLLGTVVHLEHAIQRLAIVIALGHMQDYIVNMVCTIHRLVHSLLQSTYARIEDQLQNYLIIELIKCCQYQY